VVPSSTRWYVSKMRTYREAYPILFQIYIDLHNCILQLQSFLHHIGVEAPAWEPTAHDESLTIVDASNFASTERLSYKLVEAEVLYLYGRAMQLAGPAEQYVTTLGHENGETDPTFMVRNKTLQPIKKVLQDLMSFLAYPADILYPSNQRLPETTVERRFQIYVGMMNMITQMHQVVYAWHARDENSIPPLRDISERPLWNKVKSPIYFPLQPKDTYEALLKPLTKRELDRLNARIYELWVHMDKKLMMPGTEQGKMLYGDGSTWSPQHPTTYEFMQLKLIWEKAGRWIEFWNQKPVPGSIEALEKIPGVDGWIGSPDLPPPQRIDQKKDSRDLKVAIPDWFRPKLENDMRAQRDKLKQQNENHRNRIKQLIDLLQSNRKQVSQARVSWVTPRYGANFLGIKGGELENEVFRFHQENDKLKRWAGELEEKCKAARLMLPKHPKNVSFSSR